jgi:hypothetical protein
MHEDSVGGIGGSVGIRAFSLEVSEVQSKSERSVGIAPRLSGCPCNPGRTVPIAVRHLQTPDGIAPLPFFHRAPHRSAPPP